jgi:hypothetical protein
VTSCLGSRPVAQGQGTDYSDECARQGKPFVGLEDRGERCRTSEHPHSLCAPVDAIQKPLTFLVIERGDHHPPQQRIRRVEATSVLFPLRRRVQGFGLGGGRVYITSVLRTPVFVGVKVPDSDLRLVSGRRLSPVEGGREAGGLGELGLAISDSIVWLRWTVKPRPNGCTVRPGVSPKGVTKAKPFPLLRGERVSAEKGKARHPRGDG